MQLKGDIIVLEPQLEHCVKKMSYLFVLFVFERLTQPLSSSLLENVNLGLSSFLSLSFFNLTRSFS